jgi:hypothetical protein
LPELEIQEEVLLRLKSLLYLRAPTFKTRLHEFWRSLRPLNSKMARNPTTESRLLPKSLQNP